MSDCWVVALRGFPGEYEEVAAVFASHADAEAYAAWWNLLELARYGRDSTVTAVVDETDLPARRVAAPGAAVPGPGERRSKVIVYSVHRLSPTQISEVELLTAHLALAEDHATVISADWPYGKLIIASRELDTLGVLRIQSVWERGERIADHGTRGLWRRVQDSPHWFSPPQP